MNHKGTLHVRQHKGNVRIKILYDSSYFTICKDFTITKMLYDSQKAS